MSSRCVAHVRRGSRLAVVGLLVGALAAFGCASQEFSDKHGELYQQSVEASQSGDPAFAAGAAYRYLQGATVDDPKYDRAIRLLARNTERLGLTYAASMWYLDIARSRRNVELVDDAIEGLEGIIDQYPYDRETIQEGFLASADISGLPEGPAAFVAFYRGVDSLERGEEKWGVETLQSIPETSPYRLRARYVLALRDLARYDLESGRSKLEKLLDEKLPRELETDVRRTLARTAFEQENWERALEHYRAIKDRAPEHPRLLLEMAWTHYYLDHYKRALGLLLALDAPSYRELIAPRRYLLEAMALEELCQFGPARKAALRLRERHGEALEDLYAGVPLERSDPLRRAAGLRPGGRAVAAFRSRVEKERARLDELEERLDGKLLERLREIYAQGVREAKRREREKLADEMQAVADDLLAAEEGVQLILHELGVSLLRGERESSLAEDGNALAEGGPRDNVVFRFDGEFWTDELDDLVVQLEDRCIE